MGITIDKSSMKNKRFSIAAHGAPLLQFQYEHHISDKSNTHLTIVVKSGFATKEDNEPYALEILKILNDEKA